MIGRITRWLVQNSRIVKYRLLSTCTNVSGTHKAHQPVLLEGAGSIIFGKGVELGVKASQGFYSSYVFLEARFSTSTIHIGDYTRINNGFSAVAFTAITIGKNTLIGTNCSIIDTNGHSLSPDLRHENFKEGEPVTIGDNVFIGDRVTILKGVTIGANAVIGSGSVVTKTIPENTVVAGNPAKSIRCL